MNTTVPHIEIRLTSHAATATELTFGYSVVSKSATPVYLVSHPRLPFVRLAPDQSAIEIWEGISPRNQRELSRTITILPLPSTEILRPGASVNKTAVIKLPLRESGYFLNEVDYTPLPIGNRAQFQAVLIQGYGLGPLEPTLVRNIDELYAWQLTARSPPINLTRIVR
jgi:hypothetical protein